MLGIQNTFVFSSDTQLKGNWRDKHVIKEKNRHLFIYASTIGYNKNIICHKEPSTALKKPLLPASSLPLYLELRQSVVFVAFEHQPPTILVSLKSPIFCSYWEIWMI